ncbi:MAG: hypothetical protein JW987_06055 [Anaerolineaceae bacterium]|nr:hypothetical protein [Anaerolineaceae bacterium]
MRNLRLVFFVASILAGLAIGMLYGWVINPAPYSNLDATTLRDDYKADYVLMVAEAYRQDGNLPLALRRLSLISNDSPAQVMVRTLVSARDLGYAPSDLEVLSNLSQAVQGAGPLSTEAP